jgi:dipeptidyl aminopeptidase/acylaminoacyl peptidase
VRQALEDHSAKFEKTQSVVIKSRDGLNLVSYVTKASQSKALVLTVHGGPWYRDDLHFMIEHQWLVNRGYSAMAVNFRGSTGFGKEFVNKADGQWSKTMHNDLLDACEWAIAQGICDRDKIVIMGGSYGGYATLAALTKTPDYFAAGIDIVGPSNLFTLLESTPPYWESFKTTLYRRVGDPRTEEGRKLLAENSPLNFVEKIQKPLLIIQGANDPRVKQAEADQIVTAMRAKNIPVDYVLFPDEGHGMRKPENRMGQYAIIETFLHKHFGTPLEEVGSEVKNSSAQYL